jgi:hypothetical protein
MLLTKKLMRKVSRPRAKFNGRLELPGWPGKDGIAQTLGESWLLLKGEVKEVSACGVVSGRGGAVLEWECLFKGGAVLGSFSSEV